MLCSIHEGLFKCSVILTLRPSGCRPLRSISFISIGISQRRLEPEYNLFDKSFFLDGLGYQALSFFVNSLSLHHHYRQMVSIRGRGDRCNFFCSRNDTLFLVNKPYGTNFPPRCHPIHIDFKFIQNTRTPRALQTFMNSNCENTSQSSHLSAKSRRCRNRQSSELGGFELTRCLDIHPNEWINL